MLDRKKKAAEHLSFFYTDISEHADGDCRAACSDLEGAERRIWLETFATPTPGFVPAVTACTEIKKNGARTKMWDKKPEPDIAAIRKLL